MKILWIDDEIDLLKPHVLFLEKKGYQTKMLNNATDALELLPNMYFDAVLIDENMPGLSGLEALQKIKEIKPNLPVVMVTKNEEEHIMEDAIGSHIADYLIKPVNPNQILLSLKKILKSKQIITEKAVINYQQEFRQIAMEMMSARDFEDWTQIYKKLTFWELELEGIEDKEMLEILSSQKQEANYTFSKYIEKNYKGWLHGADKPILSHTAFQELVKPELLNNQKTILIMIDNLRYDQWKAIQPLFTEFFTVEETMYYSILPTATQYARNAFFSGLLPLEIQKRFPDLWLNDIDEGGKNQYEKEFLEQQLKRNGLGDLKMRYFKILNSDFEKKILHDFHSYKKNDFTVIVYNFIDILSHAKTDNKIVKEMIRDDKTFRSVAKNWFENSYLLQIVKLAAAEGMQILLTTDHGTIFVQEPTEVVGDKETSTNLRYKTGKNLKYNEDEVFESQKPEELYLPSINLTSSFIFAKENKFFAYPKNYNQYVNYYKNTYQHGGISLEEMIIPFVKLQPK